MSIFTKQLKNITRIFPPIAVRRLCIKIYNLDYYYSITRKNYFTLNNKIIKNSEKTLYKFIAISFF